VAAHEIARPNEFVGHVETPDQTLFVHAQHLGLLPGEPQSAALRNRPAGKHVYAVWLLTPQQD
jgi:hypothetical protein